MRTQDFYDAIFPHDPPQPSLLTGPIPLPGVLPVLPAATHEVEGEHAGPLCPHYLSESDLSLFEEYEESTDPMTD